MNERIGGQRQVIFPVEPAVVVVANVVIDERRGRTLFRDGNPAECRYHVVPGLRLVNIEAGDDIARHSFARRGLQQHQFVDFDAFLAKLPRQRNRCVRARAVSDDHDRTAQASPIAASDELLGNCGIGFGKGHRRTDPLVEQSVFEVGQIREVAGGRRCTKHDHITLGRDADPDRAGQNNTLAPQHSQAATPIPVAASVQIFTKVCVTGVLHRRSAEKVFPVSVIVTSGVTG